MHVARPGRAHGELGGHKIYPATRLRGHLKGGVEDPRHIYYNTRARVLDRGVGCAGPCCSIRLRMVAYVVLWSFRYDPWRAVKYIYYTQHRANGDTSGVAWKTPDIIIIIRARVFDHGVGRVGPSCANIFLSDIVAGALDSSFAKRDSRTGCDR